jgi:ABC-type uncharacterized transport system ATPase subunit
VMIHKGRKVLDESMLKLRRRYDTSRVLFEPLDANIDSGLLRSLPGVVNVAARDGEYELTLQVGADPAAVIREAAGRVVPARVEIARVRLEDMFVGIVRGDAGESEAALRQHLQGMGTTA